MSDNDDRDMASETLRLADGATGQEVRLAYAVLSAQGHATELAAEVERLTMTNSDLEQWVADFRSKLDEAEKALTDLAPRSLLAEVERLRELSHRWQAVVYAKSFEAAVSIEVRAYHDDECLYQTERDALAATVARVEALRDRLAGLAPHTTSTASVVGRLTAALSESTQGDVDRG